MPRITELKAPHRYHDPLRRKDMDVVGSLFGLRFIKGGSPDGCIELYLEDDERYSLKAVFNHLWLKDLEKVAKEAQKHFKKGK